MRLTVDASLAVPPFEQLRTQIVDAVRDGSLTPGSRLSPVRALALPQPADPAARAGV